MKIVSFENLPHTNQHVALAQNHALLFDIKYILEACKLLKASKQINKKAMQAVGKLTQSVRKDGFKTCTAATLIFTRLVQPASLC